MKKVRPGADERTPSRSEYFSWINNTNEGATTSQTLANLAFFKWLRETYGMELDIYAFDAGAIDGAGGCGTMESDRFRRQFPEGFSPIAATAAAMGTRLGLWCGPDGFGDTDESRKRRREEMVSLVRDYGFRLFKMDAVCGQLRPEREDDFVAMMEDCRRHADDLILLNHRLRLGKGMPHATTFLWEGVETYIDVHITNKRCAPRNRSCVLDRGNVPGLQRLTEDHGVCLSSCLDGWEDDLVIQAFGRCLILAPQLYGNPWLLADHEYPRLARYFVLHRALRELLVNGLELPPDHFGPHAVSRGDGETRLLVLRNPEWVARTVEIPLDAGIGLAAGGPVTVRTLHPLEKFLGEHSFGAAVTVTVDPYRTALVLVSRRDHGLSGVAGCSYTVEQDVPQAPLRLRLRGAPGSAATVCLAISGKVNSARVDGVEQPELARGGVVSVRFPGNPALAPWHRKVGELAPVPAPADAEALYEATCFAADNNVLEYRELERSGPTAIPAVQAARDAFFSQPALRRRHLLDANLFDDDPDTGFGVCRRWTWREVRIQGGAFRLDLGKTETCDRLELRVGSDYELQPLKWHETVHGSVGTGFGDWRPISLFADGTGLVGELGEKPWRYLRLRGCPDLIRHVRGSRCGRALERRGWRASNLFAPYGGWRGASVERAWELPFTIPEVTPGAYLAIAVQGNQGFETVWAALRVGDRDWRGCPRRSPSFPSNVWECAVRPCDGDSTWYVPLTPDLVGQPLAAVVLGLKGCAAEVLRCEAWITANEEPLTGVDLVVEREG